MRSTNKATLADITALIEQCLLARRRVHVTDPPADLLLAGGRCFAAPFLLEDEQAEDHK